MNIDEMLESVRVLPEGDYAECGVWQGAMAEEIATGMNPQADLFLFDSFKGHAAPTEFDNAVVHPQGRYADTSFAEIDAKFPHAFIIAGYLEDVDSFHAAKDRLFRFVHIDIDHYIPTKAACEFFKTRMVQGGIIRFDDYEHFETPGATKAVDEIFGRENILPGDYRWISN